MKPAKHTYYDYKEVISYLEEKFNFKERDYYSYWDKMREIEQQALSEVLEKFGNTSFWTISPPKYTEEEKAQDDLFTSLKEKAEKNLPEILDFWYDYILEENDIVNGSSFTLYEDYSNIEHYCYEYQNIFMWLMEEFGEGEAGKRKIDFVVSW